jgi:transposase
VAIDGRSLPHDALEILRLRAAEEFAEGTPIAEICAMVGMGPTAVKNWKRAWKRQGAKALRAKPIPGRPPRLSPEQRFALGRMVRGGAPSDFRFEQALWTREIIRDLITREFGVRFETDWVGKLMHQLGFSPQRPVYRASQQDPDEVRAWRREVYPKIKQEAEQVGATIYFGDEASVRQDFHAGTTWAPKGRTPVVESSAKRESAGMISAVERQGKLHFRVYRGPTDAEFFIDFCKGLLADDGGVVFLIVDNASIHKARTVKKFVADSGGRFKLYYLPPYAPQLNPDEWVWKNVKHDGVGRRVTREPGRLVEFANARLHRFQQMPEVVRGFFGDPELAYSN